MNWNQYPYHALDYALKQQFGTKVYKLALDANMTCPNRDGTLDTRGCIFCSSNGSGDFATRFCDSITNQITSAAKRIEKKIKTENPAYIAYFQSFTNTYAPIDRLRAIFTEAIQHPSIKVLSIATRPDCISDEVLLLLENLNQIKPVWIELGLQSKFDTTADFIRRGYYLPCFEDTVFRLREKHIDVITHVILGLPGEDRTMMLETIRYLSYMPIQGIKLQLLHILMDTDLALLWRQGQVPELSLETYVDLVLDAIAILPPEIVIHRITGDGPKNILLAPLWSENKRLVLNSITKRFKERDIFQGCHYLPQQN